MESSKNWIPRDDAQRIAALLGEIAGIEDDVPARKRHLVRRMCEDIQADSWVWAHTRHDHAKNQTDLMILQSDGMNETQQAVWIRPKSVPRTPSSLHPAISEVPDEPRVCPQPEPTRPRSAVSNDDATFHIASGEYAFDRLIQCAFRPDRDTSSEIRFFRKFGRERFADRDRRLVQIIWSQVPWLHHVRVSDQPPSVATMQSLTPARRIVLAHLLAGRRRPEIAKLLRISENTARDHVRAVLRHFDAKDQVELVCRFSSGDTVCTHLLNHA